MASFGKVLDLFDDRYLELQDVTGNVEPLPTLVPYHKYTRNVIVYGMDTNHDVFMALLQDFTVRKAREIGTELWTWCVQWEVEAAGSRSRSRPRPRQLGAAPHSPKKPRLDRAHSDDALDAQSSQSKAPAYTVQRRILNPRLLAREDMLRTLIDIVQVQSAWVPNYVEFLYRYIDFYEGDGTALRAAMRWEIPSLWDFDYHPQEVPDDDAGDDASNDGKAKEKKLREKPNLAALERQTIASERLQYREVHYGLQPPKVSEPLPPLINIPRDQQKRHKYYAACFKSRQRAFNVLNEHGVTAQNINDYNKCQSVHPRETPVTRAGDGLGPYKRDAMFAHRHFAHKEKQMMLQNKQLEVAISDKLAIEAQLANRSAVDGPSSIPPSPSVPLPARPDMVIEILRKMQAAKGKTEEMINIVPSSLVGGMKSRLFRGSIDKQALQRMSQAPMGVPRDARRRSRGPDGRRISTSADGNTGGNDSSSDESDESDDASDQTRMSFPGPLPPPPPLVPIPSTRGPALSQQENRGGMPSLAGTHSNDPTQESMEEYIRNMTPEIARQLVPYLHQNAEQVAANRLAAQSAGFVAQLPMSNLQAQNNVGHSIPNVPVTVMNPFTILQQMREASRPPVSMLPPPRPPPAITLSAPQMPNGQSQYQVSTGFGDQPQGFGREIPPPAGPTFQQQHAFQPGSFSPPGLPPPGFPIVQGRSPLGPPPGIPYFDRDRPREDGARPTFDYQDARQRPPPSGHPPGFGPAPRVHPDGLLAPPLPGITRNTPTPLALSPTTPTTAFPSLAPSLLATSPFTASAQGIPVQIYFPHVVVPGNTVGPLGLRMGNKNTVETDAFLLGHAKPGSGKIVLSKAIFLPAGVWENALKRVQMGKYTVLETYPAAPVAGPGSNMPASNSHRAVYEKLRQAYGIMNLPSGPRERELTKRWRVTKGPMTPFERGAVWEGWAVGLDRGIEMGGLERRDAFKGEGIIDGVVSEEVARGREEVEELIEEEGDEAFDLFMDFDSEDEDDDDDEDEDMEE